jgi:hypothetical protein
MIKDSGTNQPERKHVALAVALATKHLGTTTNFCPIVQGADEDLKELALLFIHMFPKVGATQTTKECTEGMQPKFRAKPLSAEDFSESGGVTGRWSFRVMGALTTFFSSFMMNRKLKRDEAECEESGGTWNGATGACE